MPTGSSTWVPRAATAAGRSSRPVRPKKWRRCRRATPAGSSRKSWNRIGSPTPGSVGRVSTTPPNDDGIPTFDEVREKIERRAATAIGSGEMAEESPEGRTVQEQFDDRNEAARRKLDEIRKSMGE